MKRALWTWLLVFLACVPAAADKKKKFIIKAPHENVEAIASRHGLRVVRKDDLGGRRVTLLEVPDERTKEQVLVELQCEPEVEDVEHDDDLKVPEADVLAPGGLLQDAVASRLPVSYYGAVVRSAYVDQPAAEIISLSSAHYYATGAGVVAILDTGVDPNHPALRDSLVPGYDFTRDVAGIPSEWLDLPLTAAAGALAQSTVAILDWKTVPTLLNQSTVAILDEQTATVLGSDPLPGAFGHGTMTAGLVHLVAPRARIMPLKVFQADGTTDVFNIARAITWAADHGAKVINMSFSLPTVSPNLEAAVSYAVAKGVICVASVGNAGRQELVYPAALPSVIGVGSTDAFDYRSAFSNFGTSAKIAAPGEGLITTYPGNNYAGAWGTSFSTALVSGAVALMLDVTATISYTRAMSALNDGTPVSLGMGRARLQVQKSLRDLID